MDGLTPQKRYYLKNKELINQKSREYRKRNSSILADKRHQKYLNEIDKIKLERSAYYALNREKILNQKKQYYKSKKFIQSSQFHPLLHPQTASLV